MFLSKYTVQLPSFLARFSENDVAFVDIFIFSSQVFFYNIPFIFFSSLRINRAAGGSRDDEEVEPKEEVESAGQVDRVHLELKRESVCQGLCASVHP